MKKLIYLFSALLLTSFAVNAENIVKSNDAQLTNYRNYGKSFIFQENGIEFSIFPDGQFDFNIRRYTNNVNVSANVGGVSINYNSGFDYSAYLQYDEFGAIIQIENTYVDYDYYGRVSQIGSSSRRVDIRSLRRPLPSPPSGGDSPAAPSSYIPGQLNSMASSSFVEGSRTDLKLMYSSQLSRLSESDQSLLSPSPPQPSASWSAMILR